MNSNGVQKKPSGLPARWPHPSAADLDARPQRIVTIGTPQEYSFCNNSVKTSKYEWYSFLPLFLLEEFNPRAKIANCYFLLIACLQTIRPISNTDGYPTFLIPLTAVLLISAVFKGLEDRNRHIADRKANSTKTLVFDAAHGEFIVKLWSDVVVGDIVKVMSREGIPADLVVFQVSEPNPDLPKGLCYVETKSLDGETNLKMRNVLPPLLGKLNDNTDLQRLNGRIEMEHPNNLIDTFTGVIELTEGGKFPINPINVILRGCVLRSTDWMVGLVVNTGHDVKIMQSNITSRAKTSNLDYQATRQILGVIVTLLLISFTGATAQAIFNSVEDIDDWSYLDWDENAVGHWFIQFFYNLLLHASMIPVSLYVSMAIIRFTQSYFMNSDRNMYYDALDAPAAVRTMTLNEELGQVSHIFSDKTGTLTCNVMNFRKASINGVPYGLGITEIGRASWKLQGKEIPADVLHAEAEATKAAVPHVAFYDPQFYLDYNHSKKAPGDNGSNENGSERSLKPRAHQRNKIEEFYRYLSVCHEVVAEHESDGSIKLSAPNPDDEALVCAAAFFGYEFKDSKDKFSLIFERDHKRTLEIEVLYVIPFTSARKRMSVIIRDIDQKIKIVTKGADSMMFSRLEGSQSFTVNFSEQNTENSLSIPLGGVPESGEANGIVDGNGSDSGSSKLIDFNDSTFQNGKKEVMNEAEILQLRAATQRDINRFSAEGLRCLLVAAAEIDETKFAEWSKNYDEANTSLVELDKRKKGIHNDIDELEDLIERGLRIVGATAIEDRLQEGVPDCIEKLVGAGINVWVLTGDKEETAINIAVACNLVLPKEYMRQVIINSHTAPDLNSAKAIFKRQTSLYRRMMERKTGSRYLARKQSSRAAIEALVADEDSSKKISSIEGTDEIKTMNGQRKPLKQRSNSNRDNSSEDSEIVDSDDPETWKPRALIIDGPSLIFIMGDEDTKRLLLEFSQTCQAVVCCRVSPDQKREVVELIKDNVPGVRTLAIGDGANDVAMITAAHIGVGIKGEEGVQAVNASDYAIAQFRYLTFLLLKHGRYNYIRMSNLVCYMFYKNIFNSLTLFWFNFLCAFSGQKLYTEAAIQFFNLFYTSLPILLYGTYDKDVPPEDVLRFPRLYTPCIHNAFFNAKVFWGWIGNAIIESVMCCILPFYLLNDFDYRSGTLSTFVEPGATCFTAVILIVNLKMFMFQSEWYVFSIVILLLSWGSWIGVAYIVTSSTLIDWDFYFVWSRLLMSGMFWLILLLLIAIVAIKDMLWIGIRRLMLFDQRLVLQEISAFFSPAEQNTIKNSAGMNGKTRNNVNDESDSPDGIELTDTKSGK